MNSSTKLKYKNIRATALNEFWGHEYENDIYLWEGAKHNLTLIEIKKIEEQSFKDLFSTKRAINDATLECKSVYFKYLPILSKKLNNIHNLNLPVRFWQISFGYWLYRHICIVYEKYHYLSKIDIDNTSIILLDENSYFIPNEQADYLYCFCHDFGVQQLVSQYYSIFKTKEFKTIKKIYELNIENKTDKISTSRKAISFKAITSSAKTFLKNISKSVLSQIIKPKIVLLTTFYTKKIVGELLLRSRAKVQVIDLPNVKFFGNEICNNKRNVLFEIESNNKFEKYLNQTFFFCFPKIFIENFNDYYDAYLTHISDQNFKYIVSSGWIGMSKVSLYFAIANNNGKTLVDQEHAAGSNILKNANYWIGLDFSIKYITTGWKPESANQIQGGFICENIKEYNYSKEKTNVLFISHTRFPYLMEFSAHSSNSNYLREIKVIKRFINLLPDDLKNHFYVRPRKAKYFWDVEIALELESDKIKIDRGVFSESILNSKIIIIDHISTGLAQLILMKVPFLLLINNHTDINEKYKSLFETLISRGIVHYTSESAVKQLTNIYNDIEGWWKSKEIQSAIQQLQSSYLAAPSKTINHILSYLDK